MLKALATVSTPASFADEAYYGIDAFVFTNAAGTKQLVRYIAAPEKLVHLDTEAAAKRPPDFLVDELPARLAKGPVTFRLKAQLSCAGRSNEGSDPGLARRSPGSRPRHSHDHEGGRATARRRRRSSSLLPPTRASPMGLERLGRSVDHAPQRCVRGVLRAPQRRALSVTERWGKFERHRSAHRARDGGHRSRVDPRRSARARGPPLAASGGRAKACGAALSGHAPRGLRLEPLRSPRPGRSQAPARMDRVAFATLPSAFSPLELSPVSPLGTNSVVATVSQNKTLTTTRGLEVVSDATNVLALECALRRRTRCGRDPGSRASPSIWPQATGSCALSYIPTPDFSSLPSFLSAAPGATRAAVVSRSRP